MTPLDLETPGRDLAETFERADSIVWGYRKGRRARHRWERWAAQAIDLLREHPPAGPSAADTIASHRGIDGRLLDPDEAGVELLNLLRPTLAVSVYLIFLAHALHFHPECRAPLERDARSYEDGFIHEIRRIYPFFPAIPARVTRSFDWKQFRFPAGRRVVLDVYGIDHDPRIWGDPDVFRPERFRERIPDAFELVPQGGGYPATGHRCPGEGITAELMRVVLRVLVREIHYEVPLQDLDLQWSRLPPLPGSRFAIRNVQLRRSAG